MSLTDVVLFLTPERRIMKIQWYNKSLEQTYSAIWNVFVGHSLDSQFSISPSLDSGDFTWKNECFSFIKLLSSQKEPIYLFKKVTNKEFLYEQALNQIAEGIQIYDENACAVFFNSYSRKISSIPEHTPIEGQHLLDLYDFPKDISTVITSLHTKAPVIDRTWKFKTATGNTVCTVNSAYPILREEKLIGSIAFEQDIHIVQRYISSMEEKKQALLHLTADGSVKRFNGYSFKHIIGSGEKLQQAIRLAKKVAPQECTILLNGETGTGKEIFAQSIHKASSRKDKKFLPLNCAAIPDTLIESLLFGTKKGSFTGSVEQAGYFEEANGGTLFLDELNSMSLAMQSKLLRVIQEGTFRRVGGSKDIALNVRIISSCNEDPYELIEKNLLRKDFFYRLSTITINLPPLREHPQDIEELIYYYIKQNSYKYAKTVSHIPPETLALLTAYPWPGNVRELFHALDYVLNVIDDDTIRLEHLPEFLLSVSPAKKSVSEVEPVDYAHQELQKTMDEFESQVLRKALEQHGYNITQTAQALGLHRQGLQYRIKKYGIIV